MSEWDDPRELRVSSVYYSILKNKKGTPIQTILKEAREIETHIKAAKPKAQRLKIVK